MAQYLLKGINDKIYRKVKSILAVEGKTMRTWLMECFKKKSEEKNTNP